MKVLFIARSTLFSGPGGDTVQIMNTAKYLRLLKVEVDVKLSNERVNYKDYDLIHFFNIIRPSDILRHMKNSRLPYVISTIYVDYSEYDREYRGGLVGLVTRLFGTDLAEYLKAIARNLKNGESLGSPEYLLRGHRRSVQYILRRAACLLPNSHSEYRRLVRSYGVENRYERIPNAIDKQQFYRRDLPGREERKDVLCAARIEAYKNQLNLIKAFKDMPYQLKIVGKAAPNHRKYYEACVKEAAGMDNVELIEHLPVDQLAELYAKARVHVLPSWFETTGLSSLEAGAMGCRLVITDRGDQKEYFEEYAFYCEPDDIDSIRAAIERAYEAPFSTSLQEKILQHYTWETAASATLAVYEKVLANK